MLGVDLVFIPEFEKQLETGGSAFIQKAFLPEEMKNRRPEHLAGLWAAKEAVAKAASELPKKWTDIVITHDSQGKPYAKLGAQAFDISIAHHGEYAVAVAIRSEARG